MCVQVQKKRHIGNDIVVIVFQVRTMMFIIVVLPIKNNHALFISPIVTPSHPHSLQDENTPFCPNMVRSHFIHGYIVVQVEHPNTDHTVYKVSMAAKQEVADFGPPIPDPAVFQKGTEFRDWLLTKALNAEFNCHNASDFKKLAVSDDCVCVHVRNRKINNFVLFHRIEQETNCSNTSWKNSPPLLRK